MIRCLLIKIGRNQRGLPIRAERRVEGEFLRIGRSAECNLHLPDHRVSLHHAHIRRSTDGGLYIDSEHAELNVNGSYVQSAELAVGMKIHLGPYQFTVEAMQQPDQLTLAYELLQQPDDVPEVNSLQPALQHSGWLSQRKAAWWIAALIVLTFILLPVLQATSPMARSLLQKSGLNPQRLWSSGPLSNAHQLSSASCLDCHRVPFEAVGNAPCLKCHLGTKVHGRLAGGGPRNPHELNCMLCHSEHQGGHAMPNRGEAECVRCHASIRRHAAKSTLPDISDFGQDHPEFRLSIRTGVNPGDVRRVLQSRAHPPSQDSGLKFSHAEHYGLVQVPWSVMTVRDLHCEDCHQPDASGQQILPISFSRHCFECHQDRLEFEPVVAGRKLPHGSTAQLSDTLKDYYAGLAFRNHQSPQWVSANLAHAATSLSGEECCAYCHTTRPSSDAERLFDVAPLLQTRPWFPAARFPHDQHKTSRCVDCHNVEKSSNSADVAIPDLASCLKCHAGTTPPAGKVGSSCMSCHDYHSAPAKKP